MKDKSKNIINTLSIIYSSIIAYFFSFALLTGFGKEEFDFSNKQDILLFLFFVCGTCSGIMYIIQFIYLKIKNKKYLKSLNIANLICASFGIVVTCILSYNERDKIGNHKLEYFIIALFIFIIFLFIAYAYIKINDTSKLKSS